MGTTGGSFSGFEAEEGSLVDPIVEVLERQSRGQEKRSFACGANEGC